MKIVILGCGRVGVRLAQLLESEGHEISIIDSDPDAFDRLPETFNGTTTLGTGIDADVLKAAGIEEAEAFAAVTNFDNTNIMACQVAKEIFGVNNVLARIYDPGRGSLYNELGLETICPTTLISATARDILMANSGLDEEPKATINLEGVGRAVVNAHPGQPPLASAGTATATAATGAPETDDRTHADVPHRHVQIDHAAETRTQPNGRGIRGLFRH